MFPPVGLPPKSEFTGLKGAHLQKIATHHLTWEMNIATPDSSGIPPIKYLFSWEQDLIGFSPPGGCLTFSQQHLFPQAWLSWLIYSDISSFQIHSHPVCVSLLTIDKVILWTLYKNKCLSKNGDFYCGNPSKYQPSFSYLTLPSLKQQTLLWS